MQQLSKYDMSKCWVGARLRENGIYIFRGISFQGVDARRAQSKSLDDFAYH